MRPTDKVVAIAEGLQILYGAGPAFLMRWAEVHAVSFSKIDAETCTVTYLTFDYDYGEYVEIHETMEGFGRLVSDLPKYLPIVSSGWQEALQGASPEEAPVTIFERSAS